MLKYVKNDLKPVAKMKALNRDARQICERKKQDVVHFEISSSRLVLEIRCCCMEFCPRLSVSLPSRIDLKKPQKFPFLFDAAAACSE